jgi:hypothetical protein
LTRVSCLQPKIGSTSPARLRRFGGGVPSRPKFCSLTREQNHRPAVSFGREVDSMDDRRAQGFIFNHGRSSLPHLVTGPGMDRIATERVVNP